MLEAPIEMSRSLVFSRNCCYMLLLTVAFFVVLIWQLNQVDKR